jgi:oligosaccharide repeat unit polymerase
MTTTPAMPMRPPMRRPMRLVRKRRSLRAKLRRHFSLPRIVFYSLVLLAISIAIFRQIPVEDRELDVAVMTSFIIIGIISVAGLASSCSRDGMSLAVMFWFFNLFFFFVAPVAQYRNNGFNYPISAQSMTIVNLIIIAYSALFWWTYSRVRNRPAVPPKMAPRKIARGRLALFALLCAVGVVALIAKEGLILTHSMIRALGAPEGEVTTFAPQWMLIDSGLRPFFWFVFLFALFAWSYAPRKKFSYTLVLLIAAGAALVVNAPTSSSRYYVFTTFFGLLLTLYKPTARRSFVYLLVLLAALFASILAHVVRQSVAMTKGEDMSLDRRKYVEEVVEEYNPFSMQALFVSRHFDPYENTVHTYDFINESGIVWGRQALGGLFFFVPRAVWPEKPVGTGAFVTIEHLGKEYDINFTNVTSPPIMEAMVNFGIIGGLLLAVFLGWVTGRADRGYAEARALADRGEVRSTYFPARTAVYLVFYPPMVGFSLFLLRGDFLSGMAYGSGIAAAFAGAYFLFTSRVRMAPAARPAA